MGRPHRGASGALPAIVSVVFTPLDLRPPSLAGSARRSTNQSAKSAMSVTTQNCQSWMGRGKLKVKSEK
jgi:hypothetical protein